MQSISRGLIANKSEHVIETPAEQIEKNLEE